MSKDLRPIRRKFKEGDSLFDKIWLSMVEPDKYELSETYEEIKKRWKLVLTLRLNGRPRLFIANKLVEAFAISEGQAYNDIQNSDHFYGNVLKADQLGTRAILQEYATKAYKRAKKARDFKAELKAIELIGKYAGIGEDDIRQFNPEKFENKEVSIAVPPEILNLIIEKLNGGVIDFNQLRTEDADYIEVLENEKD